MCTLNQTTITELENLDIQVSECLEIKTVEVGFSIDLHETYTTVQVGGTWHATNAHKDTSTVDIEPSVDVLGRWEEVEHEITLNKKGDFLAVGMDLRQPYCTLYVVQ